MVNTRRNRRDRGNDEESNTNPHPEGGVEGQRDARPNLGEGRMDRIERILEGMARRILELQLEQRRVDALKRYLRQNPPVFRERPAENPAISEYCLDSTEKILHSLRISNKDKVECATYMLEEEAT